MDFIAASQKGSFMDEHDEVIELTSGEKKAIARLQKLAQTWPKSLMLFSQSGNLIVLKAPSHERQTRYTVADIIGIPNDGGDADY